MKATREINTEQKEARVDTQRMVTAKQLEEVAIGYRNLKWLMEGLKTTFGEGENVEADIVSSDGGVVTARNIDGFLVFWEGFSRGAGSCLPASNGRGAETQGREL